VEAQRQVRVDFEHPPAAETSLGFFFAKIAGWNVLHGGMLWERFRSQYPRTEFLVPILRSQPQPAIQVPQDLHSMIRICFENTSKTELVQVQPDLFLRNWRKTASTTEYQHYDSVLPRFKEDWRTFRSFLEEQSLDGPVVSLCEMSYFNHLIRGEDWRDFAEITEIFPVWRGFPQGSLFTNPNAIAFNVAGEAPGGQITVAVQPGIRTMDGKEILQATITVSLAPSSSDDAALFQCLDQCHETAVKGFLQISSEQAQSRWGRKP
jgi:uncharacterized protein (TIGR04255 family)